MIGKQLINALRYALISAGALACIFSSSIAHAQSWPDKPVILIIPFCRWWHYGHSWKNFCAANDYHSWSKCYCRK